MATRGRRRRDTILEYGQGKSQLAVEKLYETVMRRVGSTPKDHLSWVVRVVQQSPDELTEGDRLNLRTELWHFFRLAGARITGRPLDRPHIPGEPLDWEAPTPEETNDILQRYREVVETVIRRGAISLGTSTSEVGVAWDQPQQRFREYERIRGGWRERAPRVLGPIIEECGHLVKACPAAAPRSKGDETCGRWFVAKRPTQEYCSAICQNRANTRAFREGSETPVIRARREQKGE